MSERKPRRSWRYVAGALIIIGAFVGGTFFGASRTGLLAAAAAYSTVVSVSAPDGVDFTPVWRAWQIIDNRYVPGRVANSASSTPTGAEDPQERVWGMIQGLASSLHDPYTVFLPPSDAEIFEDDISGAFEGVGMEIAVRDSVLTVVAPLKDSPAQKAGLKAGDKITKIDGAETRGMDVGAAVKLIRGPRSTVVNLTVVREGENDFLEIPVTRAVINIPTIEGELRTDGIYIISLYNFSAVSADLFQEQLQRYQASGAKKLILDLRGNPGGYLEAAVQIASWFVDAGKVVVTEDYGERGTPQEHRSYGYGKLAPDAKMVVLVDKGSASASEILAAALREYGVATLVGTATFGKGSVQELIPITTDTSLKITVARWLAAGGTQIPDTGIEPDILVEPNKEDVDAGKDVILEKAVAELR